MHRQSMYISRCMMVCQWQMLELMNPMETENVYCFHEIHMKVLLKPGKSFVNTTASNNLVSLSLIHEQFRFEMEPLEYPSDMQDLSEFVIIQGRQIFLVDHFCSRERICQMLLLSAQYMPWEKGMNVSPSQSSRNDDVRSLLSDR